MQDQDFLHTKYTIWNLHKYDRIEEYEELSDIFRNTGTVAAGEDSEIEIYSGRSEFFRPVSIQMFAKTNGKDPSPSFEILNISIIGQPQLLSFHGETVEINRGISDFWNQQTSIEWNAFGSEAGLGLKVKVKNISMYPATLYIWFRGKIPKMPNI